MPPDDDALLPALALFIATAIIAAMWVWFTHHLYVNEIGPPPSSTLPKLAKIV